ncbi:hypothetical protein HLB40_10435 [Pseudomonas chlororaphis]|uniref:Uncharacterized protein n=1 Tax=Pseudomonas chlororaphis TaxID=587753 RepID=A0AAP9W245_9PSED|nr:hypothetical protein HLB40_10435 [Pseudomonas chlororaphis]
MTAGPPSAEALLFSNEISEQGSNPSFIMAVGKIIVRLNPLTQLLNKRHRHIGLNDAQSLQPMNFLPLQ